jgi:hypothetical protein
MLRTTMSPSSIVMIVRCVAVEEIESLEPYDDGRSTVIDHLPSPRSTDRLGS